MPKRYHNVTCFTSSKRRRAEAEFTGAEVTSSGGAPLLAEADRRLGLTVAAARAMGDDRRRKSVVHPTLSILRQRVYALVLGDEDLNDHDGLRRDTALQPSNRDAAHRAGAVLALLVRALRAEWPDVEVVMRGDGGFCRPRVMRWCESRNVGYVLGLPANSRVAALAEPAIGAAAALHRLDGAKVRLFDEFGYAARSRPRERRVVAKAEHTALGGNTRFCQSREMASRAYTRNKLHQASTTA